MDESPKDSGATESRKVKPSKPAKRKSLSMHEGKAIWCDCCSCEAEERWAALAEEMGIDLSDEEPERNEKTR